ncbi:MAG: hypothetical protein QOK42_183 [Frankiaceae bacterium]|nr:hypothetical protein [Frankiaceae bacterium]
MRVLGRLLLLPLAVAAVAVPATTSTPPPLTAGPRVPTLAQLGAAQVPGDDVAVRAAGGLGKQIPARAYDAALAQAAVLAAGSSDSNLRSAAWKLQGPTNIGGRVLDVVVDPKHANTIYLASASGGVWKSSDAGSVFHSVWPTTQVQAMGALAIASDGTLYAGTGEAGPGGGSLTYGGNGVYRSRDGGLHWTYIGLNGSERIGRIVVEPKNPKRVWVAAVGPLYRSGGVRGLFLSTDGGDHFTRVHTTANATTGTVDVAVDPVDPKVVLLTDWDLIRHPGDRQYTGGGTAVYRSADAGKTWAAVGTPYFGPNVPTVGRLGVAFAPTDHNRVYVLASTIDGLTQGFWTSTDNGATYMPSSFDDALVTGGYVYAWWFGRVYVDPKNAMHVYATGVNLSESTDGGQSFDTPSGFHADQHAMVWDPKVPRRVYLGNDGGLYRSDDNGNHWVHGTYMPWNQPFSVDVSQQRPNRITAGLQDNGGNRSWDRQNQTGAGFFNDYTGGDGTETRINPKNDQIVYGCSQYGACAVSHDGGNTSSAFDNQVIGERKNWLTPIVFAPGNPSTVYTASSIVHRSTDDGATWTPISPDLTDGEPGSTELDPLFRNYDTVTTIAVPPSEDGTIYAGTDDGHVAYTHNDGLTWTRATGLPTDWVTRVASNKASIVYAAFSGFRRGVQSPRLYRSADGGVTWKPMAGDLPQAPVNDILLLGHDIVVATDVGVFLSHDAVGGKHWLRLGSGLPQTPVWDLAYVAKSNSVYAADFGRGVYSVALPAGAGTPAVTGEQQGRGSQSGGGLATTGSGSRAPLTGLGLLLLALVGFATAALSRSRSAPSQSSR